MKEFTVNRQWSSPVTIKYMTHKRSYRRDERDGECNFKTATTSLLGFLFTGRSTKQLGHPIKTSPPKNVCFGGFHPWPIKTYVCGGVPVRIFIESTSYFLSRVSNELMFQTSTSSKHQIHHPNKQPISTVSFSPMVTHIGRSNRKRTIHTSTTKKKDNTSYDISYRVSYFGLRKREWFAVVTAVVHRDPYRPFPQWFDGVACAYSWFQDCYHLVEY